LVFILRESSSPSLLLHWYQTYPSNHVSAMADNTHNQALLHVMEERLNLKMKERFMSIDASLQQQLKELFQQYENKIVADSSNNTRPYACNTRMARLDFPRFNGDGVKNWIIQCETFFSIDQTPNDYKVRLAVVHFEGKALQWHSVYVKTIGLNNLPSWDEYACILLDCFGEICDATSAKRLYHRIS